MKRNRLYRFGAAITAALLCAAFSAQAAVPAVINYQSRLRTTAGVAITAATKVSFSLYSAATGGTALWTESYSQSSGSCAKVTPDSNGYFSVQMGGCEAFPSTLTFTTPLFLGVTIENDAEASPRVAFAPAPYAMNAVRVGNFVSDTSAGTLTGEPLGTATAGTQGFHSAGLLLQGSGWNGSAAANKGFKLRTTATDASNYRLSVLDSGDGSESVSILNNGRVGIGITNPQSALEVAGIIYANDFRTRGGSISTTGDGTNDLIRFTRPKLLIGHTADLNVVGPITNLMQLTATDVTFLEDTSFNKLISVPNRQIKFGANTLTFPVAAPAADGLVLTTDTDGTLSWTSKSSGGGGTVSSVGLSAPSDFTVSGTPVTDTGTLGFAWKTQQPNDIFAGPASGAAAGAPTFRNLVAADIPNLDAGKIISGTINAARLPTLTAADIPNLDAGKITSGILDTPRGGTGIGTYAKGQIIYADAINSLATLGLGSNGTVLTANSVTGLPEWKAIPSSSGGTVTSVSATIPSSLLTLSGSPITDSGTLAFDLATQSANEVFVGPLTGTAKPTFRGLSAVDIPALDAAKITTGTLALGRIPNIPVTQGGTGITSNAKGDILYGDAINSLATLGIGSSGQFLGVDATGVPAWKPIPTDAGGTVKSVAFTAPSIFSVIGTPITDTGTIALSLANQSASEVLVGPPAGAAPGAPTFRALLPSDIPTLDATKVPTGTFSMAQIPNLDTTKINFPTLAPGRAFIGPASGIDAKPDFRSLVASDIPDLSADQINSGTFNIARIPEIPALQVVGGQLSTSVVPTLDIATKTSGTLSVTRGGTGLAATAKGDILFSDAINSLASLGIGSTGQILTVNSAGLPIWSTPATNGTVTSVGLTSTSPLFAAFGAPVTTSGSISVNIANQQPNEFFAGPPSGATAAAPAFRQLVATDIPNLSAQHIVNGVFDSLRIPDLSADKITSGILSADRVPVLDIATKTSGTLLVTRGGTGVAATAKGDILFSDAINSLAALGIGTTGQVLSVNSAGLPVWSAPATSGTVTSVGLTAPSSVFTVSGSPVTGSGDLAVDLATQSASEVFVGPLTGTGKPTFRSLASVDIPDLDAAKITTGIFGIGRIPDLDAAKIVSGTFDAARIPALTAGQIPDLDAAKIVSGEFNIARIPDVPVAKVVGVVPVAQIPDLSADKITSGILSADRVPVLDIATKTSGTLAVTRGGTGIAATAKGDILFSDAINSLAALGIGANGTVLTANSTTGLPEWKVASGDILGGGTANSIAFFTGAKTIGDSVITQSGGNINITSGSLQFGGVTRIAANGNATFTTTTITEATIGGGAITKMTIDNSTIGGTTPAAGTFTNLAASNLTATNITGTNISATNVAATNLSASGAMTLGDSASDVLNIKASIGSDIIPSPTNLRALGSATFRFANLFTDKINVAGVTTFNGIGYSWPVAAPASNGRVLTGATDGTLSWGIPADGTVTSVALSAPSIFTVAGSPVTATGTLALDLSTQSKNKVFAGPTADPDAKPSFRALVAGDIPSLSASQITSGVFASSTIPDFDAAKIVSGAFGLARIPTIPVTQGGTGLTGNAKGDLIYGDAINSLAKLGIGSTGQILTVNVAGLPVWQAAPATGVTSVGLKLPSSLFAVTGSPITSSSTFSVALNPQAKNKFFGGPVSGTDITPDFRSLDPLDVPDLDAGKITTGVFAAARIPAIASSSVPDLDASKITSGVFNIARIPNIPAANITGVLATSSIPSLDASKIGSGILGTANGGTGLSTVGADGTVLTATGGVPAWRAVPAGLGGSGVFGQLAFWNASSTLAGNPKLIIDNTNSRLAIGTSAAPATTLVVAGDTTVGGDVIPSSGSSYDVGSSTKRIRNVYADSIAADNLGSATQRIKAAYIDELYIYGGAGGSGTSTISATQTVFNGIAYNWPNGGLGNNFVLTTDTNGNLGWQNPTNLVPDSGWRSLSGNVRLGVITDKVGIGTAAPGEKLDVIGNVQASGFLSSGTGQIKLGGAMYNFPTTLPSSGQILTASSTAGSLVWRGLSATDIPVLDASKITTGVFSSAQIPAVSSSSVPNLDASKITSGVFNIARIPNIPAANIIGTLTISSIPALDVSQITTGVLPVNRGGTGLSAAGSIGQLLTVNASGVPAWLSPAAAGETATFTGNKTITGSLTVVDGLTVTNNILPKDDNIYDIGSSTKRWREIQSAHLTVSNGFTMSLGGGTGKVLTSDASGNATWQAPVAGGVGGSGSINTLPVFTASGTIANSIVTQGAGKITIAGDLDIAATGTFMVGTTTLSKSGISTASVTASGLTILNGSIALNGGLIAPLVPASSGAQTLGTGALRFNKLFANQIDIDQQTTLNGVAYNWPSSSPTVVGQVLAVANIAASPTLVWQAPAGGIGGSGTINKLALFSATGTVSDSIVSQSAGAVTVGGGLFVTGVASFATTTSVSGDILPTGDGVQNIGSNAKRFGIIRSASNWVNNLTVYTGSSLYGNTTLGNVVTDTVTVVGKLALPNLTPGLGKVLTSDAAGNATWQAPAAGGIGGLGTNGVLALFNATGTVGNSIISQSAGKVTVGGGLSVTTTSTLAGVIPAADNLYDLGSPTARWRDIYVGPATIKVINNSGQVIESIGEGSGSNVGKLVVKGSAGERLIGITAGGAVPVSVAAGTAFLSPIGAAGAPAFRALTALDIPSLDVSKITTGALPVTNGGTGLSSVGSNGQVLTVSNGVLSWQTPAPAFNPTSLGTTVPLLGGNAGLVSGMTLGMTDGDGTQPFRLLSAGQQFFSYAKNSIDGSKNAFFNSNLYVSNIQGQTGKASAWIDDNLNVAGTTSLGDSATDTTFITGKLRITGGLPGQVLTVANDGYSVWQSPGGGDTQNKNTFTGFEAGKSTASGAGYNNVGNGYQALYSNGGGFSNVAVGRFALMANTSGSENTAVGDTALQYATANNNTAIGSRALKSNGTGNGNTAVGQSSLTSNISGGDNTAIGVGSLRLNASGNSNTALGRVALQSNGGNFNTGVGDSALSLLATGSQNVAVGGFTGGTINNMSDAVLVGFNAGQGSPNGLTNVIAVGSGAQFTKSNQVVIGNASITETLLRGTVKANGVTLTSDRRLKESIVEISPVLSKLDALHGVNFTWKDGKIKGKQLGVIAQDVEKSFPELVDTDGVTGMKSVNYSGLAAVAIQGIKELDTKVEAALPITGESVIRPGESEVLVFTSQASTGAKIFVTPVGSTGGQTLYVGEVVDGKYFTVKTDKALRSGARFNWMIIK